LYSRTDSHGYHPTPGKLFELDHRVRTHDEFFEQRVHGGQTYQQDKLGRHQTGKHGGTSGHATVGSALRQREIHYRKSHVRDES
jgi:hypothetical protein